MKLDAIDQRGRLAEQRGDAVHDAPLVDGLIALGVCAGDEQPVHPAPEVRGDGLHPPPHVRGTVGRLLLRRAFERRDRGGVRQQRDRRERHDREQQERDDQPGAERHLVLSIVYSRTGPAERTYGGAWRS
jgi:hypothetical protein